MSYGVRNGLTYDAGDLDRDVVALLVEAAKPVASNPALLNTLLSVQKSLDQTIDHVSKDEVLEAPDR